MLHCSSLGDVRPIIFFHALHEIHTVSAGEKICLIYLLQNALADCEKTCVGCVGTVYSKLNAGNNFLWSLATFIIHSLLTKSNGRSWVMRNENV